MKRKELRKFLDEKAAQYNRPDFIPDDPLSIPHRFTRQQDIEIAGLFAAILAWGNRKSILRSCDKLLAAMDQAPYDFIMQPGWMEGTAPFVAFEKFVHRTFNELDLFHLLNFLRHHYHDQQAESLESAFSAHMRAGDVTVEQALCGFHEYVFGFDDLAAGEMHCRKHIASPLKKSACKRLNMFLRWMVRDDNKGVDFGIWKTIRPAQLVCPLDVHVTRVSRRLGILQRQQNDWQAAMELTTVLRDLDAEDPVRYDFALFGLGVMEKY